jgi:trehalose 6-phosphate phosphatase
MSDQRPGPDRRQVEASASEWALFLDFDGTLVEIADRPDAVVVPPDLRPTLRALREGLGGAMAIVTGRSIAAIDSFLESDRFDVAGLHGAEYRLASEMFPCRLEEHPELRLGIEELTRRFASEPGILIEDKGCSVAVHWRLAPEAEDHASQAVAEVLPSRATKGGIIGHFLTEAPYRNRRPIFMGDDLTDEQAFDAVNASGGISVRVGRGPTLADYRVDTPAAVRDLLARWARMPRIDFSGLAPANEDERVEKRAAGEPARL